jgi:hypothetical protein
LFLPFHFSNHFRSSFSLLHISILPSHFSPSTSLPPPSSHYSTPLPPLYFFLVSSLYLSLSLHISLHVSVSYRP